MQISGHTLPFAVLGHPIGHTLSPIMHNASILSLGMDAIYLAFDVAPSRLLAVCTSMRDMGFGGVNLTVPLKEVAFQGLTIHARSAELAKSVNTLEFMDNGEIRGHSTDGEGFVTACYEAFNTTPKGQSVFVLGCGGAGRAVAITCAMEGASVITLGDIDHLRIQTLADELQQLAPALPVKHAGTSIETWTKAARESDLVIQATPIGMRKEDPPALPPEAFYSGQRVYDLIYMYPQTSTMQAASTSGAMTANGLGMLLHQGARSFEIWTGRKPDTTAMRLALEKAVYNKENH